MQLAGGIKIMKKLKNYTSNLVLCIKIMFTISPANFLLKLFCSFIVPVISLVMVYLMKWMLDYLVNYNESIFYKIIELLVIYFILKVANIIITNIERYAEEVNNSNIRRYINNLIITRCTELDISIYDDASIYNEIRYINNNYYSISKMVEGTIEIISAIVSFILIIIVGFNKLYLYAFIMIISCLPAGIAKLKYTKSFYELGINQIKDERRIDYLISLILDKNYSQEIKHYSLGKRIYKSHKQIYNKLFNDRKCIFKKSLFVSSILLLLPEICYLIIMFLTSRKIARGILTVGDFYLYLEFLTQIWGNVNRITYDVDSLFEENGKIFFLKDFLEKKPDIKNGKRKIETINSIKFANVYFKYPFSEEYVINNVSFEIKPGENIAIVGENGSGKSTLIKLLLRYYDVTSGTVYINNTNIKEYDITGLRKCIGLYFQNSYNYAFTFRENITISRDGEEDNEKIMKALSVTGTDEVIQEKGVSLDDYVTKLFDENGTELSGGEHQRLALSRTVYSDVGWFIFDEPSSALDPKIEYEFFQRIREASKNKTIIYISHRLSNITFSDKIIVMEKGKVIEFGNIDQLMFNKGKFYELYNYQKSFIR